MKKTTLSLLTVVGLFSGTMAQADYQCVNGSGQITMKIDKEIMTRIGDTSVLVETPQGSTLYFGQLTGESGLFSEEVLEFYPYEGEKLTIVTQPKFCGRGSCQGSDLKITALLEVKGASTEFSCHVLNP